MVFRALLQKIIWWYEGRLLDMLLKRLQQAPSKKDEKSRNRIKCWCCEKLSNQSACTKHILCRRHTSIAQIHDVETSEIKGRVQLNVKF